MRTTTEISRRQMIGRSSGHNSAGVYVIGPVLVEIVVTQTTVDGRVCRPSYSVEIDGRHQFGGFADHFDGRYRTNERPAEFLTLIDAPAPSFDPSAAVWVPDTGEVFLAADLPLYVVELLAGDVHFERYSTTAAAVDIATDFYAGEPAQYRPIEVATGPRR
jgi:hypothetical protein